MKDIISVNEKGLNSSHCYCINLENMTIQDLNTAKDSRSPSQEEMKKENGNNKEYINFILINRKTLRGRKEKISIPKTKLKCGICLEISNNSSEGLISCSICKCLFHISCYEQYELSTSEDISCYMCIRCAYALKMNKNINDFYCFICGNSNGVLNKNSENNEFYHKICLNLLIELKGLELEEITKDNIRKWRYKNSCRYCGEKLSKNKAVIKCKKPKCKQFFHIPCSIEKGMIFDLKFMKKFYNVNNFSEIPFYCSNHNKKISFSYKNYILNGKSNKNNITKIYTSINYYKEKISFCKCNNKIRKSKRKIFKNSIIKRRNDKRLIFTTTKNNKSKLEGENNNINNKKEVLSFKEEEINAKENIDNFFEIKDKNDIFNTDFEKLMKYNNNNNIYLIDDVNSNFNNKNYNCDSLTKEKEENSIFFIH